MNFLCPSCRKPLLSGFSPRCNHCGIMLPPEVLFAPEKRAAIEADELRARQALAAAEEERKLQTSASRRRVCLPGGEAVTAALAVASTIKNVRRKKNV